MLETKKEWHSHIKCHEGYRSKFEAGIARQLEEAGVSFEYEVDRLEYRNHLGKKFYIPDFTVYRPDGSVFYIEAKGWVDGAANSKMQAVRKFNLHADIRFVFQKENTKVANLKSTVCQWAKRLRYGFAVGAVPAEWLAEAALAAA